MNIHIVAWTISWFPDLTTLFEYLKIITWNRQQSTELIHGTSSRLISPHNYRFISVKVTDCLHFPTLVFWESFICQKRDKSAQKEHLKSWIQDERINFLWIINTVLIIQFLISPFIVIIAISWHRSPGVVETNEAFWTILHVVIGSNILNITFTDKQRKRYEADSTRRNLLTHLPLHQQLVSPECEMSSRLYSQSNNHFVEIYLRIDE